MLCVCMLEKGGSGTVRAVLDPHPDGPQLSPEIRPCHATPRSRQIDAGNSVTALFPGRSAPCFPRPFRTLNKTEPSRRDARQPLLTMDTNEPNRPTKRKRLNFACNYCKFQLPAWSCCNLGIHSELTLDRQVKEGPVRPRIPIMPRLPRRRRRMHHDR